jgi:hypothetical protein
MAEPSQLFIEEILYPTLDVRSNNGHNQQGDRAGTALTFGQQVMKVEGQPGKYGLAVSVSSDNAKSVNAPYNFVIEAYAICTIGGTALEGEAADKFIMQNGLHIVMGAIREHLASMTARAPWGRFMINAIPLQEPMQITTI